MADERAQLAILGIDFEAPDAETDELHLAPVIGSPIGILRPRADEPDSGYQMFPESFSTFESGGRAMSVSPDDGVVSGAWQRDSSSEAVGAAAAAPAVSVPDLPVQMCNTG